MKKIVWLCTPLNVKGGTYVHIMHWARYMSKKDYNVSLIYACNGDEDREQIEEIAKYGIEVIYLPKLRDKGWGLIVAFLKIVMFLRRENVDILHTIFIQSDLIGAAASIFSWKTFVISSVEGRFNYFMSTKGKFIIYKAVYSLMKYKIRKVIAISNRTMEEFCKDFNVEKSKMIVIRNGVYLNDFPWERSIEKLRHNLGNNRLTLGYYGQIAKNKGVLIIINALRQLLLEHKDVSLLLIGEGKDEQRCRELVNKYNIGEHVKFISWQRDIREKMLDYDIFLLPSSTEGIPWSILENMACAKPVIATDVGGISEVIKNKENGLIVRGHDEMEVVKAIHYLLANTRECIEIGLRGRRTIEENFSIEREIRELEALYDSLIW